MAKFAAIFIDVENIAYFLKERIDEGLSLSDEVCDCVRFFRDEISQESHLNLILQFGYGDFERLGTGYQRSFYLMGVESRNVLGSEHKNAADMRLCIDAMATLYQRAEIETFVLMGGDRDYIPLVQHVRQAAKSVLVGGFRASTSGDLLSIIGDENFRDLTDHLSPAAKNAVENYQPKPAPKPTPNKSVAVVRAATPAARPAKPVRPITDDVARQVLESILGKYGDKAEIWLRPCLYELDRQFPQLADYERKAKITDLESAGALSVEERDGDPNPYRVIVLNWNHPDVQSLNP